MGGSRGVDVTKGDKLVQVTESHLGRERGWGGHGLVNYHQAMLKCLKNNYGRGGGCWTASPKERGKKDLI